MVSDKFRHQLRTEAKLWQAEGLIDNDLYQQLSSRYQFNQLDTAARDRFTAIFLGLGGILVGLAVITFVAANWQAWSRETKVIILLSLFISINAAGFYLWRIPPASSIQRNSGRQRFGQGLLLLGALILGANMALMAQMFHIGGSPFGLYLVWGIGVLAMAYSLRLTSLGVLSILLISWGYFWGVFDWNSKEGFNWLLILIKHTPLLASLVIIPLAYWCRSRAIFALGSILIIASLETSLFQSSGIAPGLLAAIAWGLPPALLWGYDDSILPYLDTYNFQPLARNLAVWFLGLSFYICSFQWWRDNTLKPTDITSLLDWVPLVDVIFLTALSIWEWLRLGYRSKTSHRRVDLTTNVIACFIAISALIPLWHYSFYPIPLLATFLFNGLLFLLAAGLIKQGLSVGDRGTFWGGLVLLSLQIFTRMLEYNTDLLLKAFVFFLCGIGVIIAGIWFEKQSSKALKNNRENLP